MTDHLQDHSKAFFLLAVDVATAVAAFKRRQLSSNEILQEEKINFEFVDYIELPKFSQIDQVE